MLCPLLPASLYPAYSAAGPRLVALCWHILAHVLNIWLAILFMGPASFRGLVLHDSLPLRRVCCQEGRAADRKLYLSKAVAEDVSFACSGHSPVCSKLRHTQCAMSEMAAKRPA